jgi:hypothetical protein
MMMMLQGGSRTTMMMMIQGGRRQIHLQHLQPMTPTRLHTTQEAMLLATTNRTRGRSSRPQHQIHLLEVLPMTPTRLHTTQEAMLGGATNRTLAHSRPQRQLQAPIRTNLQLKRLCTLHRQRRAVVPGALYVRIGC